MAHQRRSPQHRAPLSSISSPFVARRKYPLRRATSRTSSYTLPAESISSPVPHRAVLVPLHNLRRLPSRQFIEEHDLSKGTGMREASHVVQVGAKRKRVVSENAHSHARPTRSSHKRQKATVATRRYANTSEESESEVSGMEIDPPSTRWSAADDSEPGEENDDEGKADEEQWELDSTDDHLLHVAPASQLNRCLKTDLIRLYNVANLPDDPETLTKYEIVAAVINARHDDLASLPPSSPPGKTDGASSDYSSDDGNVAGDEETDAGSHKSTEINSLALRRRVTMHDIGKGVNKPTKGRSLSMGNLLGSAASTSQQTLKRKASLRINTETTTRQRTSTRSSPSTSAMLSTTVQASPAHRLRSRKVSAPTPVDSTTPTPTSSKGKGKGKAKQVEFSTEVVQLNAPSRRTARDMEYDKEKAREQERSQILAEESDLTELDELEDSISPARVSPRRLRSKDRERGPVKAKGKENEDLDATPTAKKRGKRLLTELKPPESERTRGTRRALRITPMRKAKVNAKSLKESDVDEPDEKEEEEEEEEEEEVQEDELEEDAEDKEGEEGEEPEQGEGKDAEDADEEDEVDELVSSASITPPPLSKGRHTPVLKRLRQRRGFVPESNGDEENEGDDEQEADEDEASEEEGEEGIDDEDEEENEAQEGEDAQEDDETTIAVEPRKLRNGKIVGEDDVEMVEEEGDIDEEGEEAEEFEGDDVEAEEVEETEDGNEIDVDVDCEIDEDETMEEEVDLTVATAKTLVRLRRDDLVRLCETRDLEPIGTKPQLAEALLQWRDRHINGFSSPSSSGTVRPPSTTKKRRRKKQSSGSSVPVLFRSEQVHTDEPRTPVPGKEKENDQELELDLESLGLEDREIPPEKLQKLEKIGSGGFKDVFIGKFKGRRIAISEFRGQLSAMDIKELKLLGGFDHPNIVRFLGVSIPENTKETPVMIVSELCSNGDLFDYIRNVAPPSLHKVLVMMLDIARGLEYLHMRKPSIIHRDCKSSNILITAKGTAKIADFGLAKVKQSTRSMVRSLVGTVNWQAPELWSAHPKYNHKVDVFSCSMVYWEMLQWHLANKKFPWEGMNEHAIYEVVGAKRQRPSVTGLKKQWCPEIVDLIERMWAQEHQERPTVTEVVERLEELVKQY